MASAATRVARDDVFMGELTVLGALPALAGHHGEGSRRPWKIIVVAADGRSPEPLAVWAPTCVAPISDAIAPRSRDPRRASGARGSGPVRCQHAARAAVRLQRRAVCDGLAALRRRRADRGGVAKSLKPRGATGLRRLASPAGDGGL